jgi:hypoxanthine-guanine phosphoribosyltransferase
VRRAAAVTPDHAGFRIEDLFVVGYGMDAGGTLRHLPYIGVVR